MINRLMPINGRSKIRDITKSIDYKKNIGDWNFIGTFG